MKKLAFFLILSVAFSTTTFAQITLDTDDLPNIGDVIIDVDAQVNASISIGNPGANQTYDFSSVTPIDTFTSVLVDPSTTPGSSEFPNATHATGDVDAYFYLQETMDAILQLGLYADTATTGPPEYFAIHLMPPSKVFEIPSTYNTDYIDMTSYSFTIEDPSGTPGVDSLRITNTATRDVLFDGYGTVLTPDGSYDCLRERVYTTTNDLIEALTIIGWIEFSNETTMDTSYNWYAAESPGPLVSVTMFNGAIVNLSYTGLEALPMAPVANFSSENMAGGQVNFTDLSNHIPTSWLWDFGDGSTSTDQHPQHIYPAEGDYTVCLTVTNSLGSDMICQTVSVSFAPIAAFNITELGLGAYSFTDLSANNPITWLWDFGDGNTSTEQNPSHTYSASGTYMVCLTVTNSLGSDMICAQVSAIFAPFTNFSYTVQGQGNVDFQDESVGDPTLWLWDFGDGNFSNLQNPQHIYSSPGTYTVCLTASNSAGSSTTCLSVVVAFSPVASFSYVDQSGGAVDFTDESSNDPDTWAWDFGDGNNSTEQNPQHNFAVNGTYDVCLTASNSIGGDMTCQMVTVIVTGTNELSNSINIAVTPNPVNELLNIQLTSSDVAILDFQLVNTIGQIILEKQIDSNGVYQFDVRSLASGIYYYKLLDKNGLLQQQGSVLKAHE